MATLGTARRTKEQYNSYYWGFTTQQTPVTPYLTASNQASKPNEHNPLIANTSTKDIVVDLAHFKKVIAKR